MWDTHSARKDRLPDDWELVRQRILIRDNHSCQWLDDGISCGARATHVDHITSGTTGSVPDDELRALCEPHHQHKTAYEGAQASRAARARARRPVRRHPGLRW